MFNFLYKKLIDEIQNISKSLPEQINSLNKSISICKKIMIQNQDFEYIRNIINPKFDLYQLTESDLEQIIESIKNNLISLKSTCQYFSCKPQTFHNFINNFSKSDSTNIIFKKGRKPLNIANDLLEKVQDIHNYCELGYKRIV